VEPFPYHEQRVPHISPSFGEMWESAEAGVRVLVAAEKFPVREQLDPTSRQKKARYGAPAVALPAPALLGS
jgi:hypothetical protein